MAVRLGPILSLRDVSHGHLALSALWVLDDADGPPNAVVAAADGSALATSAPTALLANRGRTAWRVDWQVPRAAADGTAHYGLGTADVPVTVAGNRSPLRLGFASCNGFSSDAYANHYVKRGIPLYERWSDLREKHEAAPLHLLLMGGDQVYGDGIWKIRWLDKWRERSPERRVQAALPASVDEAIARFYFDLYVEQWSAPERAHVLARVPTLMIWDDHDIFDGWGSHPHALHGCPVFQGIFARGRDAFDAFQLQVAPGGVRPGTIPGAARSMAHRIGDVAIVALDLRSQRDVDRILDEAAWAAAFAGIRAAAASGPAHLLLVTSVPVVWPRAGFLPGLLELIPGEQNLEDDLRDFWSSDAHRAEQQRLLEQLFALSNELGCRVTIVSGDVHFAALGLAATTRIPNARPNATEINNLISSAIVHKPPIGIAKFALETFSRTEELKRGVTVKMIPFQNKDVRFVAKRNWLRILAPAPGERGPLHAEWFVEEHENARYVKEIAPVL